MTNVGTYRDMPATATHQHEASSRRRPTEKTFREVSAPPGLMLTAMLARRIRVEDEEGTRWMSGYDALANVLGERSAAGDERAALLLSNLSRYAPLTDPREVPLPAAVAPQTQAEKALATAFVRRTLEGLAEEAPQTVSPERGRRRKGRRHV